MAQKYKSQVQSLLSGDCFLLSLVYITLPYFTFFHYLVHSEPRHIKGRIFTAVLIFTKAEDADLPPEL